MELGRRIYHMECRVIYQRIRAAGTLNFLYKATMSADDERPEPEPEIKRRVGRQPRTCEMCLSSFAAFPSEIARGAGRYCSKVCRAAARSEGRRPISEPKVVRVTPSVEAVCEVCCKTFAVNPHRTTDGKKVRFCSVACRALGTGVREITCPNCGILFRPRVDEIRRPGSTTQKCCSTACRWDLRRKEKNQKYEAHKARQN